VQPKPGSLAAVKLQICIADPGNPFADITVMAKVSFVMKAGAVCTSG